MAELHRVIGKLKAENDFFIQSARSELDRAQKQKVVAQGHPKVSVAARCKLLGIARAGYYRGWASYPGFAQASLSSCGRSTNFICNTPGWEAAPWQIT